MIELDVIENRRARPVMDELRSLVEESGVVLVGLNNEEARLGVACRDRKVVRHAANEEARVQASALEDPREHGGHRGLPVRTGDGEHVFALQGVFGKPLRTRGVAISGVEDRFHQWITARDYVADNPDIRPQGELVCAEPFSELDSQRAKLIAHGRIHVGIASGNAIAGALRDGGDPAHECSADAQDVDVRRHEGTRFYD
jgi:hypothetical protein